MKIIIAPDKFKGSCPADRVAAAIAKGWKTVFPQDETVLIPIADGGDGTLDAMRAACGGDVRTAAVRGPMGGEVRARWLRLGDGTAVVEMAQASGLALLGTGVPDIRRADTFGTGQLMLEALRSGCRRLIVGIGGSATSDGGMGMLRALGARFLGTHGELSIPGDLLMLQSVDFSGLEHRIAECAVTVASDVTNPLCGSLGAAAVYGPQKGAGEGDIRHMDRCLGRLAEVVAGQTDRDTSSNAGAGAAGGLGWALMQCCNATLRPGIDIVLDAAGFDCALADTGLVITGEGRLDGQTAMGKAPAGIAMRAAARGVPVAMIAGALGDGHEAVYSQGVVCAAGIAPGPIALAEAMEQAEELTQAAAARLARAISLGMTLGARI